MFQIQMSSIKENQYIRFIIIVFAITFFFFFLTYSYPDLFPQLKDKLSNPLYIFISYLVAISIFYILSRILDYCYERNKFTFKRLLALELGLFCLLFVFIYANFILGLFGIILIFHVILSYAIHPYTYWNILKSGLKLFNAIIDSLIVIFGFIFIILFLLAVLSLSMQTFIAFISSENQSFLFLSIMDLLTPLYFVIFVLLLASIGRVGIFFLQDKGFLLLYMAFQQVRYGLPKESFYKHPLGQKNFYLLPLLEQSHNLQSKIKIKNTIKGVIIRTKNASYSNVLISLVLIPFLTPLMEIFGYSIDTNSILIYLTITSFFTFPLIIFVTSWFNEKSGLYFFDPAKAKLTDVDVLSDVSDFIGSLKVEKPLFVNLLLTIMLLFQYNKFTGIPTLYSLISNFLTQVLLAIIINLVFNILSFIFLLPTIWFITNTLDKDVYRFRRILKEEYHIPEVKSKKEILEAWMKSNQ